MEDRVLSGAVLLVLVAAFGWHGVAALFRAFRATTSAAWAEQAIQGGLGTIASAVIADVVLRLLV
jgi:hypothetical protein